MKTEGKFSWNSSLMEIVSAEERISKTTEKPYMVVKARMVFFGNALHRDGKSQIKKVYTMLCFSEPLFGLFEAGNHHTFEGELSFDWGNTWLKITKLYDDSGNRLLRPEKKKDDEYPIRVMGRVDQILEERKENEEAERKRRSDDGWPCTQECEGCEDQDCLFYLPY